MTRPRRASWFLVSAGRDRATADIGRNLPGGGGRAGGPSGGAAASAAADWRNGTSLSVRGSGGRPSARSPMMLACTWSLPPAIRSDGEWRKRRSQVPPSATSPRPSMPAAPRLSMAASVMAFMSRP